MNSTSSVVNFFSNTHGAFTEAHVTCAMCVNTLHFSKVVNLYFWRPIWFPTIHPSIQWVLDPVPADWARGRLHPGQYIIVLTKRQGEPFMLTFISMASLESSNKLACMPLHPVTCRKPWDRFKLTIILLQGKYHASLLSRDALFPWSP